MLRFKRVHDSGTDALITKDENWWRVEINLREPNHNPRTMTGAFTIDGAKSIADHEVSQDGHVCNGSCQDWRQA